MRNILPAIALLLFLSTACAASQISAITMTELESRATHIVLAKVTKVVASGDADKVSIEVTSFLKGQSDAKSFTFTLVTRGGIKDFGPQLKVGDAGVFFLKQQEGGTLTKAYWGSMAIFPRNYFDKAEAPAPATPPAVEKKP